MKKLASLILICVFSIMLFPSNMAVTNLPSEIEYDEEEHIAGLELTKENLMTVLEYYEVEYAEIVFNQAMLESGHLKSNLARNHNNLFGMRVARSRPTMAVSETASGYAHYTHWSESVQDYKLWQDMKEVSGDYYTYLKRRGYAKYPGYMSRLKSLETSN